jgi:hypothetical protein
LTGDFSCPRILTSPTFIPHPNAIRPAWSALYQNIRRRADLVQTLLRQHGANAIYILKSATMPWIYRCAVCASIRRPYTTTKLFILPSNPIPCTFQVRGEPTRGMLEGIEAVSGKPMMRIHLSYQSWPRINALRQLKEVFYRGTHRVLCADQRREIWDMAFPHVRIGQGFEYVSRLIRFGPPPQRKRRRSPWPFYGSYDRLIPSGPARPSQDLSMIQFMVDYARRDRSVNHIRVSGSAALDAF